MDKKVKVTLSFADWKAIGVKGGWMKSAQHLGTPSPDLGGAPAPAAPMDAALADPAASADPLATDDAAPAGGRQETIDHIITLLHQDNVDEAKKLMDGLVPNEDPLADDAAGDDLSLGDDASSVGSDLGQAPAPAGHSAPMADASTFASSSKITKVAHGESAVDRLAAYFSNKK